MMRKYLVGAIAGFFLATAISAHAEVVNMIGKVVDGTFDVTVNGKKMPVPSIVIEGTTYAPVRSIGESLNMDVGFDMNTGVSLKTKPPVASKPTIKTQYFSKATIPGAQEVKTGAFYFVELDGNQYVSPMALFGEYVVYWETPNFTFKKTGSADITVEVMNDYTKDVDAFKASGNAVVKLAKLGYKASVGGDTLVIEKQ